MIRADVKKIKKYYVPKDVFNHVSKVRLLRSILNDGGCLENEKYGDFQKVV